MSALTIGCSPNLVNAKSVLSSNSRLKGCKQRPHYNQTSIRDRSVCLAQQDEKRQQQPSFAAAAAALTVCASVWGLPLAASAAQAEVYEGMFSGQASTEIADVAQSMNVSQNKINKVVSFLSTCAEDTTCNDDLAKLREDMQSAVRNSQVAIRSAGKNAEYDPKAVDLMFIADEFDCIEIRRDKSTAFLVNQFGAAKVGAGVLGADHTKDRQLCSPDADKLFGKGPKTSVLAKEALPTISKAAAIINDLKSALV